MPDESAVNIPGVVKIKPEPSKAIFALETAFGLLEVAKGEMENKQHEDAYEDSKNAMRMASAAIMYNDGYFASTIDGTYEYVEKKYGESGLVKEWKIVEEKSPENRGFVNKLLEALGLRKRKDMETDARRAFSVAETFVQSAKALVMMGATPAWETTIREE